MRPLPITLEAWGEEEGSWVASEPPLKEGLHFGRGTGTQKGREQRQGGRWGIQPMARAMGMDGKAG